MTQSIASAPRMGLALRLVGFTLGFNIVEMCVGLAAGYRDHSLSLESFGFDSFIEIGLGALLWWRLKVEAQGARSQQVESAERLANRWVGIGYYVLAVFITVSATSTLWHHTVSTPDLTGVALAVIASVAMPLLARAKRQVGTSVGSEALKAEAGCSMICGYMSVIMLVGLAATRWPGWWWADPLAALGLLYWIVQEGREAMGRSFGRAGCCGNCHQ